MSPLPVTYHPIAMFGYETLGRKQGSENNSIAGAIIFGSSTSVYDDPPWQKTLIEWLKAQINIDTPILGICYGHQLFAHMLGGKVGFINQQREKFSGFRTVEFDETSIHGANSGQVVVSHREIVTEVPQAMRICAHSTAISVEGLVHTRKPIWTYQGHPEATAAFMDNQGITQPKTPAEFGFGHSIVQGFLNFCLERIK